MRDGWEIKKLSELFDVKSSKRVHKSDWQQKGVPFYRAREVVKLAQNGTVDNELFITEELFHEYTKDKGAPKKGDMIISAVGTLGQCYLVKEGDRFYFKDASVLWFENISGVNTRYIEYAFQSELVMQQVLHKSMGATVGTLTISRAKNIEIPIPPLTEQHQIVTILDQAFEAIDQAKANIERNIDNARELFQSKLNQIFSQRGEGWEEKPLGSISKIMYGYTSKVIPNGNTQYLRITDIQDGEVDWNSVPRVMISEEDKLKYGLKFGDIVFARTGATTGKSYLVTNPPDSVFASYLIRVQSDVSVLEPSFLYLFFQSGIYWRIVEAGISGSAQGGFNASKLADMIIHYPKEKSEQVRFVELMRKIEKPIEQMTLIYETRLENLEELRKSILQKAFEGELTGKEVEV
jgi:type I restriction enzyme S subunit